MLSFALLLSLRLLERLTAGSISHALIHPNTHSLVHGACFTNLQNRLLQQINTQSLHSRSTTTTTTTASREDNTETRDTEKYAFFFSFTSAAYISAASTQFYTRHQFFHFWLFANSFSSRVNNTSIPTLGRERVSPGGLPSLRKDLILFLLRFCSTIETMCLLAVVKSVGVFVIFVSVSAVECLEGELSQSKISTAWRNKGNILQKAVF